MKRRLTVNASQYLKPITETPQTLGELRDLVNHLCDLGYADMSVQAFNGEGDDYEYTGGNLFPLQLRISPIGCIVYPIHLTDLIEDVTGEILFTLEEVELEAENETE